MKPSPFQRLQRKFRKPGRNRADRQAYHSSRLHRLCGFAAGLLGFLFWFLASRFVLEFFGRLSVERETSARSSKDGQGFWKGFVFCAATVRSPLYASRRVGMWDSAQSTTRGGMACPGYPANPVTAVFIVSSFGLIGHNIAEEWLQLER